MTAAEQLHALRARVDRARRATAPGFTAEMLDAAVSRVLAERERSQAEAAASAERARVEALATGGPCRYCGTTQSWEHDIESDQATGRWFGDSCAWCESDRQWGVSGRTDAEHRDLVVRRVLPVDLTQEYGPGYLAETAGFRWWSQTPGAVTSATARFVYVDVDEMAARLAPRPIEYSVREPCSRCGCPALWFLAAGQADADPHHGLVSSWRCHGCGRLPELDDVIAWATGLTKVSIGSLGPAVEQVLGVAWWATHPNGGAAEPPRPCAPFAYLDRVEARRRAFEVFGRRDFAELAFAGPAAYAAARAAAA